MSTWAEVVIVIELWAIAVALWVMAFNSRPVVRSQEQVNIDFERSLPQ